MWARIPGCPATFLDGSETQLTPDTLLSVTAATRAGGVSLTQVAGVNCLLGAGNVSVMRFCPSVCVTIAAPTFLCPTGLSTQTGTTGSVTPPWTAIDEIRGLIIVPPGVAFFVMSNIDLVAITCVALFGVELPIPPLA